MSQNSSPELLRDTSLNSSFPLTFSSPPVPLSESRMSEPVSNFSPSPSGRFRLNSSSSWFHSLSRGKTRSFSSNHKNKKKNLHSLFDESLLGSHKTCSENQTNQQPCHHHQYNNNNNNNNNNNSITDFQNLPPSPRPEEVSSSDWITNQNSLKGSSIFANMSTVNLANLGRNSESCDALHFDEPAEASTPLHHHPHHPAAYYTIDSKRLASRHKKNLTDRKLLYGVKQFNVEPKKGIRFLIESNFLEENAKNIASFLYREGRLSKKQIGQYLGDHNDFNRQVLREFVATHEFTHLILVQALRQFLWSFRLPGEAMQIDRVMEAFAAHYCTQNPHLFDEVDTCYILSFSIIMLNTALHNPNIRHKISLEQFILQNRGINSGKDLPSSILELIYRNIKEEPFKIPKETYDDLMYTFFSPEKEGWLLKQGGSWKNWKRRWFLLSDKCLYYFTHTAENVPKGIIPLENVKIRSVDDKDGKLYCFEVYSESNSLVKGCKTDAKGTVVQGNHRVYRMSASCEEERSSWVNNIRDSIKEHPFYDIIASKKLALRRKALRPHAVPSCTIATSTTTLVEQLANHSQDTLVSRQNEEDKESKSEDRLEFRES